MLEIYALLNPKVANYNGTGGVPSLTPEDVAACLGRIKIAGPALLVRAMSGDATCYKPLLQIFRQSVAHMAMLKHWKTGPKYVDYFEGLVESVLHFYLKPRICGRCRGHTFITLRTGERRDCPVCVRIDGNGARVVVIDTMETDKARAAGIPIETWRDVWKDRYEAAKSILSEWESMSDGETRKLWRPDI